MTRSKNDNKHKRVALRKQHTVKPTTPKTILKKKKEKCKPIINGKSKCPQCNYTTSYNKKV
jgi:hypothetical protein